MRCQPLISQLLSNGHSTALQKNLTQQLFAALAAWLPCILSLAYMADLLFCCRRAVLVEQVTAVHYSIQDNCTCTRCSCP
jgi:hypothetical protein